MVNSSSNVQISTSLMTFQKEAIPEIQSHHGEVVPLEFHPSFFSKWGKINSFAIGSSFDGRKW